VPLTDIYKTELEYQIYGNVPVDMRRPPISDDLKDSIGYMRRRIEIKHKNMELDMIEAENKRKQRILEEEMAKDDNGDRDFSKYLFDNVTGKVTDISRDFRLSQIAEDAKKRKFKKQMVEQAQAVIADETHAVHVRPEDYPIKRVVKTDDSMDGISFTDEELDGIDITGNHLFIHDSTQERQNHASTNRTSS
jgi:hypothetical protein